MVGGVDSVREETQNHKSKKSTFTITIGVCQHIHFVKCFGLNFYNGE